VRQNAGGLFNVPTEGGGKNQKTVRGLVKKKSAGTSSRDQKPKSGVGVSKDGKSKEEWPDVVGGGALVPGGGGTL